MCSYTCLILKNPVIGHLLRGSQVKFSSVWLQSNVWTWFGGNTWRREILAVLGRGNIDVPFSSQRILVSLCLQHGKDFDISDSFVAGKAIFMLSFVNCLTSQSFYTQSVKWKEKDYFVLFSQHCLCLDFKLFGIDISAYSSICCDTVLIGYCPVIVLWRINIKTNICQILASFRKTFMLNWCSNAETISISSTKYQFVIIQESLRVCILSIMLYLVSHVNVNRRL